MKKFVLGVMVAIGLLSCKENSPTVQLGSLHQVSKATATKFPTSVPTCDKSKHLFEAIPHWDTIGAYNFKSVACLGNTLVVNYDHPTNDFYELQCTIKEELNDNKIMFKYIKLGYGTASKYKYNKNDTSDLNLFDNAFFTVNKEPEYDAITYHATYKDTYSILLTVRGKELSDKVAIDNFLKNYLEAFHNGALDQL